MTALATGTWLNWLNGKATKLRNVEELDVAAGGAKIKSTYGLWEPTAAYSSFMLIQALHKILPDEAGSFIFD